MSGTETQALPTSMTPTEAPASASPTKAPVTGPLSQQELARRLALGSIELIGELWTIAQKQVEVEIARHARLEGKATALMTAIGLSLTVAFTFGATLMTQAAAFANMRTWVVGSYGVAIVTGLVAAALALRALLLHEQRQVNEDAVFGEELLRHSDRHVVDDEKEGLMEYRKSLILHFWEIRQRYDATYRRKARFVRWGQWSFMGFLGALLCLCIPIVLAVISKGMTPPPPEPKDAMVPPSTKPINEGSPDTYRGDGNDRTRPPAEPPPSPPKK